MLPPFHGERMRTYEAVMREAARARARRPGRRAAPSPCIPSMQAITLEVILRAVFGVAERDRLAPLLRDLLAATTSTGLQVSVMFGRRRPLERLHEMAREIDELLLAEIARRAARSAGRGHLLAAGRARFGRTGMDDREIRDQLMTLLIAGHETTATGLAWALDLLAHHPRGDRPRADGRRRVPARGRLGVAAPAARSCRSPAAGSPPTSTSTGISLPAGTDVTPAIWLAHTRAQDYPEPYAFRPERFLDQPPSTYTWVPFGGGVRRCIGAAFAELEMRTVLDEVLSRFELRPASRRSERVARRNVTFSPRHGTRVVVRRALRSSGG